MTDTRRERIAWMATCPWCSWESEPGDRPQVEAVWEEHRKRHRGRDLGWPKRPNARENLDFETGRRTHDE